MYVVIGKIEVMAIKRLVVTACRLYDTNTGEVKDISINRIKSAVKRGIPVYGFEMHAIPALNNIDRIDAHIEVCKTNNNNFKWSRVPRLNGNGTLYDQEDGRFMTVIGWDGFAEMKVYHLINWRGKEFYFHEDELLDKIEAKEVNGVVYSTRYHRPIICNELNFELQ